MIERLNDTRQTESSGRASGLFNFIDNSVNDLQETQESTSKNWRANYGNFASPLVEQFDDSNPCVQSRQKTNLSQLRSEAGTALTERITAGTNLQTPAKECDHIILESPFAPRADESAKKPGILPAFSGNNDLPGVSIRQMNQGSAASDWLNLAGTQKRKWQQNERATSSVSSALPEPLSRSQRQMIESCFYPRTNMDGFLQTGGLTGSLCGLASWRLDQQYNNTSPELRLQMKWWKQFSPMLQAENELKARIAQFKSANQTSAQEILENKLSLSNSSKSMQGLVKSWQNEIASGARSEALVRALKRQRDFVQSELPGLKSKNQIKAFLGSTEQVLSGKAIFVEGSDKANTALHYRDLVRNKDPRAGNLLNNFLGDIDKEIEKQQLTFHKQAEELNLLKKKVKFITDFNNTLPEYIKQTIGTNSQVTAGRKLFVENSSEAKILQEQAKNLSRQVELESSLAYSKKQLSHLNGLLSAQLEKGAGSWIDRTALYAGKGLLATGSALALGYALDKSLLGHEPQLDMLHLFSDGVLIPITLQSRLPAGIKISAAATILGASRLGDIFNRQAGSARFSAFLRPNGFDALGATAIALSRLSWTWKLAGGAGVFATGRIYNQIARAQNWDGSRISALNETADKAFKQDQAVKTAESFKSAVQKEKEMGREIDDAIKVKWEDWWARESSLNRADFLRGSALILDSLGQTRLELGSRLDPNDHDMTANRILKGQNYDFGGEAAQDLRSAAMELVHARNYIAGHGADNNLDRNEYMKQLETLQSTVEDKLAIVYGPHNIDSIFSELQKADFGKLMHALSRIRGQIRVCNTTDSRHKAKLARDVALGDLALYARVNADTRYYLEAAQYISMSEELDPYAADNRAMRCLANRMAGM